MADALASGASVRKDVGVQVPPRAPVQFNDGPLYPRQACISPEKWETVSEVFFEPAAQTCRDKSRKG